MAMRPVKRFMFRGEAYGVAGHVRWPNDFVIPVQASVALPSIGGRAVDAVNGGSWCGVLSFSSAFVAASADYDPAGRAVEFTKGNHSENVLPTITTVSTEVRDLRIVNSDGGRKARTLSIARLASWMQSKHSHKRGEEPEFEVILAIEGVAIDGCEVVVRTAHRLCNVKTYKGLVRRRGDKRYEELFEPIDEFDPAKPPAYILCTLCEDITAKRIPNCKVIGPNSLHVQNFGKIYFAEMVFSPVDRRLSMLRIELGSTVGGEIEAGGSGLDGHTWPP